MRGVAGAEVEGILFFEDAMNVHCLGCAACMIHELGACWSCMHRPCWSCMHALSVYIHTNASPKTSTRAHTRTRTDALTHICTTRRRRHGCGRRQGHKWCGRMRWRATAESNAPLTISSKPVRAPLLSSRFAPSLPPCLLPLAPLAPIHIHPRCPT